jgi:DNA-binding CsgD family transcriptional regulator
VLVDEVEHQNHFARRMTYRHGLAAREAHVLALLRMRVANTEIADRMNISRGTLKGYLREIAFKLDLDGVGELREYALTI